LKPKGYADNTITITINDEKLLEINSGSYTMLRLKPGAATIAAHSLTAFTNRIEPIKVERHREYQFLAKHTYFIYLKQINEEFRGVFYDPQPIGLREARTLEDRVTAFGDAQQYPIESVDPESVDDNAGDLPPAFPEELYPREKYLLKPSPFKR